MTNVRMWYRPFNSLRSNNSPLTPPPKNYWCPLNDSKSLSLPLLDMYKPHNQVIQRLSGKTSDGYRTIRAEKTLKLPVKVSIDGFSPIRCAGTHENGRLSGKQTHQIFRMKV